jgi:hypothetical protein
VDVGAVTDAKFAVDAVAMGTTDAYRLAWTADFLLAVALLSTGVALPVAPEFI